jgi:hypothetical protein
MPCCTCEASLFWWQRLSALRLVRKRAITQMSAFAYDVVLESNGIIRHVQLKSSFLGLKVREVDASTKLLRWRKDRAPDPSIFLCHNACPAL